MMPLRGKVFLSLDQIRAAGLSLAQTAGIQIACQNLRIVFFLVMPDLSKKEGCCILQIPLRAFFYNVYNRRGEE
jgi:hypothetical protein